MRFIRHGTTAVVGLLSLAACADGTISGPGVAPTGGPRFAIVPAAPGPAVAGAPVQFPLYAGGGSPTSPGTLVGTVDVYTTADNRLSVTYSIASGYCLTETHLATAATPASANRSARSNSFPAAIQRVNRPRSRQASSADNL